MADSIYERFRSPGNEYRGKPFWSWNGLLKRDELLRQIEVIREMGWGGFFMHSRTGLRTEYLGEEWFDLINACADKAEELGLEAWLYDEDRWPSGYAGGKVTADPAFRRLYLRCRPLAPKAFAWRDGLVAAFVCRLDGFESYDARRLAPGEEVDPESGLTVLEFTVEEMACGSFYNGQTYVDTMNPEATRAFIEATHEAYRVRCGERIGGSIRGVFTDEPHRGLVMCSSGVDNEEPQWLVPWTGALPATFRERFGYDLVDRLPDVFLRPEGRRISQVKWHFLETLQQLYLDNWAKPCDEWCRENGMILTGHVLHEDTLGAQTVPCGSMMRYYEHMEYPGVDVLTEGNRCYWIVKQCASVARQLGRKWLLSELYGCTGWQMPLRGHKAVGDWQSLFGVTLRCPHLSWYTMAGEAKRDFPASIFHQSAWWRDYAYVEDYFSRMQLILSEGEPCCDLLVVSPVESVWAQVHTGWATWLDSVDPDVKRLDEVYQSVFHWLCGAHVDFDYADEDHIARFARVEAGAADQEEPILALGRGRYRGVIVAGLETIRSTTLDVLDEFHQEGGLVTFIGPSPSHVDALPSGRAVALGEETDGASDALPGHVSQDALRYQLSESDVTDAAWEVSGQMVSVADDNWDGMRDVYCQVRETEAGRFTLALNTDRDNWKRGAHVQLGGPGHVEEWDCATGERFRIPARWHGRWLEFDADFAPGGEHLWLVTDQADRKIPLRPTFREVSRTGLAGPFAYELDEPNVCVLDRARYRLNGGEWSDELEILKADRVLRRSLGLPLRGGEMAQPWFASHQEHPVVGRLELRFELDVDDLPTSPVYLALETPKAFTVTVNDTQLDPEAADGWWVDCAFVKLPVPAGALRPGRNVVALETDFRDDIDLEALYLLGEFGVRVDGTRRTLAKLPECLAVGDVVPQGLPFYTGKITYLLGAAPAVGDASRVFLELGEFEGACAAVPMSDGRRAMMAWPPYEADITADAGTKWCVGLEVVLTRRNVFGPLHQVPLDTTGYGPGNWISEGRHFSEGYNLYTSGLLEPPNWVVRKVE